jgi:hypothetical protein
VGGRSASCLTLMTTSQRLRGPCQRFRFPFDRGRPTAGLRLGAAIHDAPKRSPDRSAFSCTGSLLTSCDPLCKPACSHTWTRRLDAPLR